MVEGKKSDPALSWVTGANTIGSNFSVGSDIAVDDIGNSYVTGWFGGTVDFGGIILTSVGDYDIFIAKYLSNGKIEWARQSGGIGDDEGYRIVVDTKSNIYVAGIYDTTASFQGIALSGPGYFLAKYSPDGNLAWVKGGVGGASIALDSANNIYLAGDGVIKYKPGR